MVAQIYPLTSTESPAAGSDRAGRTSHTQEAARYDAALVVRFNAGDAGAFDEIITRYREKIAAFAFTVLRNHSDAEEIAQDTLIRAHRGLDGFRGNCSLATWLYTIALNLSRNRYWYYFRRHRQTTQSLDCAISDGSPATFTDLAASDAPGPVRETTTREFTAVVASCISNLTPVHRQVLEHRIIHGCSYDEIAEALGISVGTVKSRIARARENLRTLLAIACPEFAADAEPFEWFDAVRPVGVLRQVC